MKKLACLFWILGIFFTFQGIAQPPGVEERSERIESLRIAFLTKKLNLTPAEAQKFWPLHNQYMAELDGVRKESKLMRVALSGGLETMSDQDVAKLSEEFIQQKKKEWEIIEKYDKLFKAVLPARKVVAFYIAEREFKSHILRELKERQGAGGGRFGGR